MTGGRLKGEAAPSKQKRSSTLTMRMTQETRDALEAAAAAEGRSVSEMAERWFELARSGDSQAHGQQIATAFNNLLRATAAVEAECGKPDVDPGARLALIAAWRIYLPYAVPHPPPTAEDLEITKALSNVRLRAADFVEACVVVTNNGEDQSLYESLTRERGAESVGGGLLNSFLKRPARKAIEVVHELAQPGAGHGVMNEALAALDEIEPVAGAVQRHLVMLRNALVHAITLNDKVYGARAETEKLGTRIGHRLVDADLIQSLRDAPRLQGSE